MLALNPNEEALLAWPGLDTLIRRVILRRPEDPIAELPQTTGSLDQPQPWRLFAADLSWYRITSRDAGSDAGMPIRRESNVDQPTGRPNPERRAGGRGIAV